MSYGEAYSGGSYSGSNEGESSGNSLATALHLLTLTFLADGEITAGGEFGLGHQIILDFECDGMLFGGTGVVQTTRPTAWTPEDPVTGTWFPENPIEGV